MRVIRSINYTHAKNAQFGHNYNLFYGILDDSDDVQERQNVRYFHADLHERKKNIARNAVKFLLTIGLF